jgi:hypothetical protein
MVANAALLALLAVVVLAFVYWQIRRGVRRGRKRKR